MRNMNQIYSKLGLNFKLCRDVENWFKITNNRFFKLKTSMIKLLTFRQSLLKQTYEVLENDFYIKEGKTKKNKNGYLFLNHITVTS